MKIRYLVILVILILVGTGIFYRFGRSIYSPILTRIKGKETSETIKQKIESSVFNRLKTHLNKIDCDTFPEKIILLGLKEEQVLEVYVKKNDKIQFLLAYPFTAFSGKIGPKLKQGDRQIPEGIYKIEYLNPNSAYYLSMKVNYPNSFDKKQALSDNRKKLGGDIFIHGKSASIGCIPVGDKAIEELFILVSHAMNRGVKVIISPKDFRVNRQFPVIENVNWEDELYTKISQELNLLPKKQ